MFLDVGHLKEFQVAAQKEKLLHKARITDAPEAEDREAIFLKMDLAQIGSGYRGVAVCDQEIV